MRPSRRSAASSLDLTGLAGVVAVDETSGLVEVLAGTFGPDLEAQLAGHGLSVGHFPQSFDIATVGGWVACRGAGQYSTRYGKIEEMVAGLEVVLADGSVVRTGIAPAAAIGPDLGRLFLGAEGTLGIVTRGLAAHPSPAAGGAARRLRVRLVRRRGRRLPADLAAWRHARGAAAVRRGRVAARPRRRRHRPRPARPRRG
ncbi:MAG: FAD-binding oxidoreductase [Ilumatobacteraceae bacterium]